jgi:hypothetical protein
MRLIKYKICILVIAISACHQDTERPKSNSSIQLDSSVTHFVESFIKETHCEDALNSITIDKILPDSTIITVQTKSAYRRYFKENPRRRIIEIRGIPFFYYDGTEEFLINIPYDTTEVKFANSHDGEAAWTYVKSGGKVTTYKDGGGPFFYPTFYLPKPNVEFLPLK